MPDHAQQSAAIIQRLCQGIHPIVGIVCGSGLHRLAEELDAPHIIPYESLEGFPKLTVEGHKSQLVLGYLGTTPVCILQGRQHYYEGFEAAAIKTYVRTLHLLGCQKFIATNASGSLRSDYEPGDLMVITDHINLQGQNPLVGPNNPDYGPRFLPMGQAYDPRIIGDLATCARSLGIPIKTGVYVGVLGPVFETAAEIRMFHSLGGDAVGMSTIPEVYVARHCGMQVAAIATITNWGTGLASHDHNHEMVLQQAELASHHLKSLIYEYCRNLT